MPFVLDIQVASRRLQELADVFTFGSRRVLEEFADLTAAWTDHRAERFQRVHLEPQQEIMAAGERLIRQHVVLATAVGENAREVEARLQVVYAHCSEAETAISNAGQLASNAEELASGSAGQASRIANECQSVEIGITAASVDPGW